MDLQSIPCPPASHDSNESPGICCLLCPLPYVRSDPRNPTSILQAQVMGPPFPRKRENPERGEQHRHRAGLRYQKTVALAGKSRGSCLFTVAALPVKGWQQRSRAGWHGVWSPTRDKCGPVSAASPSLARH